MPPRVVLHGELAELWVHRELIAESLVQPLDLIALVSTEVDGLLVFSVRERRRDVLRGLDLDDLPGGEING